MLRASTMSSAPCSGRTDGSQRGSPSQSASQPRAGVRTFGNRLSLGAILLMNDGQRAGEHDREIRNSPQGQDAFMLKTLVFTFS